MTLFVLVDAGTFGTMAQAQLPAPLLQSLENLIHLDTNTEGLAKNSVTGIGVARKALPDAHCFPYRVVFCGDQIAPFVLSLVI